jgi:hypothetical protein
MARRLDSFWRYTGPVRGLTRGVARALNRGWGRGWERGSFARRPRWTPNRRGDLFLGGQQGFWQLLSRLTLAVALVAWLFEVPRFREWVVQSLTDYAWNRHHLLLELPGFVAQPLALRVGAEKVSLRTEEGEPVVLTDDFLIDVDALALFAGRFRLDALRAHNLLVNLDLPEAAPEPPPDPVDDSTDGTANPVPPWVESVLRRVVLDGIDVTHGQVNIRRGDSFRLKLAPIMLGTNVVETETGTRGQMWLSIGQAVIHAGERDLTVTRIRGTLESRGGQLGLTDGHAEAAGVKLDLEAGVNVTEPLSGHVRVGLTADLSKLRALEPKFPKATGDVRVELEAHGGRALDWAAAQISAKGVTLGPDDEGTITRIGDVDVTARYEDGLIKLEDLHANGLIADMHVKAEIKPEGHWPLTARAQGQLHSFGQIMRNLGTDSIVDWRGPVDYTVKGELFPNWKVEGDAIVGFRDFVVEVDNFDKPRLPPPVLHIPEAELRGFIRLSGDGAWFREARISGPPGYVDVHTWLFFSYEEGMYIEVKDGDLDLKKLGPIAGLDFTGRARLKALVRGPYPGPTITGELDVKDASVIGRPLGHLKGKAYFGAPQLLLAFHSLSGFLNGAESTTPYIGDVALDFEGAGRLGLVASIDKGGRLRDTIPIIGAPMSIAEQIEGPVTADFRYEGPLDDLRMRIRFESKAPVVFTQRFERIAGLVFADHGLLQLDAVRAELSRGALLVAGAVRLAPDPRDPKPPADDDISLTLVSRGLTARQITAFNPSGILDGDGDGGSDDGGGDPNSNGGSLSDVDFIVDATATPGAQSAASAANKPALDLDCGIALNVLIHGPTTRPTIEATLATSDTRWYGRPAPDLDVVLLADPDRLRVHGMLSDGTVAVSGEAALGGGSGVGGSGGAAAGRYRAVAFLRKLPLPRWVPSDTFDPGALTLDADGVIFATGQLSELADSTARIELSRLSLEVAGTRAENDEPIVIGVRRGLDFEQVALEGELLKLSLAGRYPFSTREQATLQLTGRVDTRLANPFLKGEAVVSGQVQIDAQVAGAGDRLALTGQATLKDVAARMEQVPIAVNDVNGLVRFTDEGIVVDDVTGFSGGGSVVASGLVPLKGLKIGEFALGVRLSGVRFDGVPNLPATVDGDLAFVRDNNGGQQLTGDIVVKEARFTKDFVQFDRILSSRAEFRAPQQSAGGSLGLNLGIDIPGTLTVDNDLARLTMRGDLRVTGTTSNPVITGTIVAERGTIVFRNAQFRLQQASLNFTGAPSLDPHFDVIGEAPVSTYRVTVRASGNMQRNRIDLSSFPALPSEDVNNLLLFGITRAEARGLDDSASMGALGFEFLASFTGVDRAFRKATSGLRIEQVTIASGYSRISRSTEPRLRLVLRPSDDLRLIYTSSLNNAVDRIAQLEYRLTSNSVLRAEYDNANEITTNSAPNIGLDLKLRWEW